MDWQDIVLALSIVIAMATFIRASNASLRKELKSDIVAVKVELKGDIVAVKGDITVLQRGIIELKEDVTELKEDVTEIKGRVERMGHHMAKREGFDEGVAYARTHAETISE